MVCSQRKPKIPSMARRPLLISFLSPAALASSDLFLEKPKGSNKLKGTGWGMSSKAGFRMKKNKFRSDSVLCFEHQTKTSNTYVFSGGSSAHVVGQCRGGTRGRAQFGVELKEANKSNNLELGCERKGIPLFRGAEVSGRVGSSGGGQGPGEHKVALHNVSNESGHGNTSVLDFGVTQPGNSLFLRSSPEGSIAQGKGVEVLDDGVQAGGEFFKVLLCSRTIDSNGVLALPEQTMWLVFNHYYYLPWFRAQRC